MSLSPAGGAASKAPFKALPPDIIASVTCSPRNSTKLPTAQIGQSSCVCACVNDKKAPFKRKMSEILMSFLAVT